ncbi:MAG: metallophosphoesterase [Nanoarchaeota archaeon]
MKIGIISDTHDCIKNTLRAFEYLNENEVELVLHCGDWVAPFMLEATKKLNCPIKAVFGNNEGARYPYFEKIKREGLNIELGDEGVWEGDYDNKRIAITHGHQPVILKLLIDSGKYDLVASGHTHMANIEMSNKTTHVNPGAIMGAKKLDIFDKFTLALYDTETNRPEIVYLDNK